MTATKKSNRRRYYLHYRLRKDGFQLNTKSKTIALNYLKQDESSKYIEFLRNEFAYSVQIKMPEG